MSEIKNHQEYFNGIKDCKEGKPHKSGQGVDYDNGYRDQYELEQIIGAGRFN